MGASTSSDLELLLGRLSAAAAMAEIAFDRARRVGDEFQMMVAKACEAEAAQAAGASEKAEALFAEAEQRQKKREPESPLLYSLQGYRYCDRFLSQGEPAEAARRAMQTIDVARFHNWVLPVVLDTMTIGRAHLAMALSRVETTPSPQRRRDDGRSAAKLEEAVDGLREAGANEFVVDGLRARAAFRRAIGDWNRAAHDLNEAKEIAEPGLMRLYLCDCALEGARLALARREAFAPLNGLVEPSPPPPVLPDPDATAALTEEARKELDVARKLIAECGYHRRDEELAELDAVVAGGRRFADLPPRV
jgi:hypothetical protein